MIQSNGWNMTGTVMELQIMLFEGEFSGADLAEYARITGPKTINAMFVMVTLYEGEPRWKMYNDIPRGHHYINEHDYFVLRYIMDVADSNFDKAQDLYSCLTFLAHDWNQLPSC
jgi:hypothetical protein